MRILASGRGANYDGVDFAPRERYDVTIWPVDARTRAVRVGDDGL